VIATILLLAGWAVGGGADETTGERTPKTGPAPVVEIGETTAASVEVGDSSELRLLVRVAAGHRVQANPASNEFLVPLEIRFEDGDGLVLGQPVYPEALPYRLEGTEEDLRTYAGEFEIVVPILATDEVSPGSHHLSGELHFQACNSRMCLFPASIAVATEITVSRSRERPE
jgi:hypothetical protein